MDTENAGPCEDELEASEMKVKKWLGELIEDSDSCEPEPAVVKHEVGTTTVATATGRLPPVLGTTAANANHFTPPGSTSTLVLPVLGKNQTKTRDSNMLLR
ncbi:hypothetical protein PHLCEN_2v4588 [Hermanssonia centrifuga]|uniref:Uncharacterized protein n=1 Tax=Hermanssonia centrifuga TaxID=98765 RepID=A0A2R6PN49_9APHY|nr:hypothetical protein PHLCEN_2v4588 [Hermanssonia centrifuga]